MATRDNADHHRKNQSGERLGCGGRYGRILPAKSHPLRLAKPDENDPALEALVLRAAKAGRPLSHPAPQPPKTLGHSAKARLAAAKIEVRS